ncbi:MAG: disulfide oxidoreductase [Patescibacteria group bacterium]
MSRLITKRTLYSLIFLIALIAMGGSLYYSEIVGLTPCLLCWYQRIAMYPIVVLSLVGLLKRDPMLPRYVLPLSIMGALIAAYQYILQRLSARGTVNIITPCAVGGTSCATIDLQYFGFITIPFMSLVAFILIALASFIALRTDAWK